MKQAKVIFEKFGRENFELPDRVNILSDEMLLYYENIDEQTLTLVLCMCLNFEFKFERIDNTCVVYIHVKYIKSVTFEEA